MANKPETAYVREIGLELDRVNAMHIKTHGSPFFKKGTPDIIGSIQGYSFVIEAKVDGNVLEPKQVDELNEWAKSGAIALVADKEKVNAKEVVFILLMELAKRQVNASKNNLVGAPETST